MTSPRTVVLNGDLGSGKTTASKLLAARLGVRSPMALYRYVPGREALLDDVVRRVHDARVDVAELGEAEEARGVVGVKLKAPLLA